MNIKNLNLSTNEKMGLVSNLSTMLAAGIPIIEVVDSLLEDAKGAQKIVLQTLKEDINQGNRIYLSFQKFPRIFDKVTVNIVKAAEEAGTLDQTLKDLRINIKKDQEFVDKVRSAMIYPVMILVVFIGVLLMILTFVVPKISVVFSRMHTELPLPTKILIFLSDVVLKQTFFLLTGLGIVLAVLIFIYKTKRQFLLSVMFSLPLVSRLAREIDLTRFTRSLFLLLSSGIPIVTALDLAKDVITKKEVKQAVEISATMVLGGKPLSEGFKLAKKTIPRIMIKITEAGEKSGSLDKAMQDISENLEYEVTSTLTTVVTLLEPIMLIFVGVMVGGMMLAIIAPIYGLIGSVGTR
jgi:type II secretory pathway component PulF